MTAITVTLIPSDSDPTQVTDGDNQLAARIFKVSKSIASSARHDHCHTINALCINNATTSKIVNICDVRVALKRC